MRAGDPLGCVCQGGHLPYVPSGGPSPLEVPACLQGARPPLRWGFISEAGDDHGVCLLVLSGRGPHPGHKALVTMRLPSGRT